MHSRTSRLRPKVEVPPFRRSPCAVNTGLCLNAGTCYNTSTGSRFLCACAAGYYGERCGNFDPCSRQPCLNGAACRNLTNSTYACDCVAVVVVVVFVVVVIASVLAVVVTYACDCVSPMYGSNCCYY